MKIDTNIWNDGTKTEEELAIALILKAQNNDHTKFEYIRNLDEKYVVKTCIGVFSKLSKYYKKIAKALLKQYKDTLKAELPAQELIIAHQEMKLCSKFYKEEVNIYCDMLDEFKSYLWSGHFLDIYLYGNDREEKDLHDMRGIVHDSDS